MKKLSSIIAAAIFMAMPSGVFAWGKIGHGLVAEVAFTMLDSNTKANVHKYLGSMTIEQAANWMDEIKNDHRNDFMKQWHYVNVDEG